MDKIAEIQKQLTEGLANFAASGEWRKHLDVMAELGPLRMGRLSFGNQILLIQQANSREDEALSLAAVATFNAWKEQGRCVKKGAKALWVLRPGKGFARGAAQKKEREIGRQLTDEEKSAYHYTYFSPLPLFSVSQTEGEPLPTICVPSLDDSECWGKTVEALRSVALIHGVKAVHLRDRQPGDGSAYGWLERRSMEITVLTDCSRAEQLSTMVHELAHALLHANSHDRASNEVEAESVAYVVCKALGCDTSGFSFGYITQWATKKEGESDFAKAVERSGSAVARASTLILTALSSVSSEETEAE